MAARIWSVRSGLWGIALKANGSGRGGGVELPTELLTGLGNPTAVAWSAYRVPAARDESESVRGRTVASFSSRKNDRLWACGGTRLAERVQQLGLTYQTQAVTRRVESITNHGAVRTKIIQCDDGAMTLDRMLPV